MKVNKEKIFIFHKRGSKSHYLGLLENLNLNDIQHEFYEFSVFTKIYRSIAERDFKLFKKQVKNITFMIKLLLSKDRIIVLGIEPFDSKLNFLQLLLQNHHVYYHTSWANWEGTFFPKASASKKTIMNWSHFLKFKVAHIFTVSLKAKVQMIKRFQLNESDISVVFHSINPVSINYTGVKKRPNSYIFFGRLVEQKGIIELLELFSKKTNATITFVGDGPLNLDVIKQTRIHSNIHYSGNIENKLELMKKVAEHEYFIQYSKKTSKWEELFGISMLEAMWLGLIVLSTDHSGPSEVLGVNYVYLFSEENFIDRLNQIIDTNPRDQDLIKNLQGKARLYTINNIAPLWNAIHHRND